MLPQYHQSHLNLASLFASHLCHLPHILPQIPYIPQLIIISGIMFLLIQFPMILKYIPYITWLEFLEDHEQFLVILLSIVCPATAKPFETLSPSYMILGFFSDAFHYTSRHHSCTLTWSALLPPTLLWCFHKLEFCRQCLMQSLYQEKLWSYSIYSIAESNDYLQHDWHTCQGTTGSVLLGQM